MKTFIAAALIMTVGIPFNLFGARVDSPSESAERDMEAFKNRVYETVLDKEAESKDISAESLEDIKLLYEKLVDFDYEILEENIEGETATVKVRITTYAFGEAFQEMMGGLFFAGLISAGSDLQEVNEEKMQNEILKNLISIETKDYSDEVVIHCQKDNTEWSTDLEDNEEFLDAVYGGTASMIKNRVSFETDLEDVEKDISEQQEKEIVSLINEGMNERGDVSDTSSKETDRESHTIGSFEVQIPSEWKNDEEAYYPVNMHEPPEFRVFYSDVFADFDEIREAPGVFRNAITAELENETIVDDIHMVQYNHRDAYTAIVDSDMGGYRIRMRANFFEDPAGGLLCCFFYEETDEVESHIQDYWDILNTLRISDETSTSGSGPLGAVIRLVASVDDCYKVSRVFADKTLVWDEESDCYYDERSDCWVWYNTNVEPDTWQYWYEGVSSDFGDYGWMEHDADGWFIEKSYGEWVRLPDLLNPGNLWYIEDAS